MHFDITARAGVETLIGTRPHKQFRCGPGSVCGPRQSVNSCSRATSHGLRTSKNRESSRPEFPTRRDMTVRTGQPRAQTARVDVTAAGNQLSNGAPVRKTYIDALCVLRVRDVFKTGTGEGTSTAARQMRPGLGTPAPVLHDSWLRSTTVWHSAASPAAPPTG